MLTLHLIGKYSGQGKFKEPAFIKLKINLHSKIVTAQIGGIQVR